MLEKIEKNQKRLDEELFLDGLIGQLVNGWRLAERHHRTYVAVCDKCGAKRSLPLYRIKSMDFAECKHPVDFSDPAFIGKRFGHLTVVKHVGGNFTVKCDCGFEKSVKCSAVNNGKTTTCGRRECEYHVKNMNYLGKYGELVREVGEETENNAYQMLLNRGYNVKKTPTSSDYGVDLIITDESGKKTAIQVKNNKETKSRTGVHAVMEVFSGGHYYDCDSFAIMSFTGYTDNAIKMAKKLGVELCDEKFELIDISEKLHFNVKYTWTINGKTEAMINTFRKNGWDAHSIERFVGMTFEEVKNKMDLISKKRINAELRKEKGVSQEMVYYRMKKMGMTFEEAISTPKVTQGRPRKQISE